MSKYKNVKTVVDGITFDSQREADRYSELKLLVRAGTIKDLELQPVYPVVINGYKICKYIADFRYVDLSGRVVVEDCKGFKNATYVLKKKLVEALHDIRILET